MKRWLFFAFLIASLLALSACAGKEEATPAPATPAPTAGKTAWEQEWERVLAVAKQEGKVAVVGAGGAEMRKALTEPFQKKYGITVEFLGASGREIAPRIKTERDAGQYLWDVMVHGTTTGLESMVPAKALDPIEPALILPEVKEAKNWRGGALEFADKGRLVLVMTPFQRGTIFVNGLVFLGGRREGARARRWPGSRRGAACSPGDGRPLTTGCRLRAAASP